MRPYLALIKDSFRAAVASNVLYVLLGVITLLLLIIAPLHVRESLDWRIRFGSNVTKVDQLVERIVERGEDEDYPAINRIWGMLDGKLQTDLKKMVSEKSKVEKAPLDPAEANSNFMKHRRIETEFESSLNDLIQDRDFYVEEAWAKKRMNPEARDLIDEGVAELNDERSRRLNRLLMASAFGGLVQRGSGNALELWYGPWQWESWTFSISFNDFANGVLQTVTYFFDKFVLSIGLFIAILVTANFIPETFLPGSLNLLMSKPISRWGLLLAKFVGGCAFVSLCAVYLFLGLWLWLGFGMGIWDRGILWGIPLYIVVFAIYYSVSTFIGVYSRSPILAIIVTGLFWAACFGVGLTYQLFEGRISNARTRGLVAVKDNVLHVGELNSVSKWSSSSNEWQKAVETKMMEEQRVAMNAVMFVPGAGDDGDFRMLGPVYDPRNDVVLSGVMNLGNPASVNHQDLFVANPEELKFEELGKLPRNALKVAADDEGAMAFTSNGLFWRYIGNNGKSPKDAKSTDKKSSTESTDKKESQLGKLAGSLFNKNKKKKSKDLFESIGPDEPVTFRSANSISLNPSTKQIFVCSEDKLIRFDLVEGKYEKKKSVDVENSNKAIVESAGKYVVAVFVSGKIQLFDCEKLEEIASFRPQENSPYQKIAASPKGNYFAFLLRDKTVWLLKTDKLDSIKTGDAIRKASFSGQGKITAIGFNEQNQLWYATRHNQVSLVDLEESKVVKSHEPATDWIAKAFDYGVNPLYWMFPKPGEFYKLVRHLSANPDDDQDADVDLSGLSDADPWQPLWSGLLFMCAVLFVTGLIFQFRDF